MSKPFITLEQIAVRHRDRWLLEGLSWQINEGEVWTVVGPNGAGKTTLAKAIAGLLPVVKGKIHYHAMGALSPTEAVSYMASDDRRDVWRRERVLDHARSFSGRFSDVTLVRDWIEDNANCKGPLQAKDIADKAGKLHLDGFLERPIMALSTGEMSRVLLLNELLRDPRLLILDEPFDGIDQAGREALREILCVLVSEGTPIVLITHRQEELLEATTHVLEIADGRIVDASPIKPLFWADKMKPSESLKRTYARLRMPKPEQRQVNSSADSRPIVEMKNVTVRYGYTTILDNISWTVREGERWSVTGPNGAGKSTLFKLITGECLQVYANQIHLFGKARGADHTLWEIRQKVGVVSHELVMGYQKKMSAFDVVCSGFFDSVGLYRYCDADQIQRARKWIDRLQISSFSATRFNRLSQGERQMVLIARAMVKTPQLLILDEPCSGLDSDNRRQVLWLVESIAGNGLPGLIFMTHHRHEIPRCTTHRLVLNHGNVLLNQNGREPLCE